MRSSEELRRVVLGGAECVNDAPCGGGGFLQSVPQARQGGQHNVKHLIVKGLRAFAAPSAAPQLIQAACHESLQCIQVVGMALEGTFNGSKLIVVALNDRCAHRISLSQDKTDVYVITIAQFDQRLGIARFLAERSL
jgi:hypothetical protein